MSAELLSCPFCGGEPLIQEHEAHTHSGALRALIPGLPDHPGSWTVECCDVGMIKDTRDAVIEAWNRRASPANTAAATVDLPEFEKWLRTVCFQRPTPEAYDLAKDAWQAARAKPALTDEPAHLCIAPACGNCTDCSAALPADVVRRSAIKYALVCKLDPRFGMPVEWLGCSTFDEAIERRLNGEKQKC